MVNAMTASHANSPGALPSVSPIVASAQKRAQTPVPAADQVATGCRFAHLTVGRDNLARRAETAQCARVVIASFHQPIFRRFRGGARTRATGSAWWITLGRFPRFADRHNHCG